MLHVCFRDKVGAAISFGNKNYEAVLLSCSVPYDDYRPDYVSIVTTQSVQPSTFLPVMVRLIKNSTHNEYHETQKLSQPYQCINIFKFSSVTSCHSSNVCTRQWILCQEYPLGFGNMVYL